MSDEKNAKSTGHNYDGIEELDNSLPRWWLASFYITIVFGIGYYAYYELGSGPTIAEEFEQEASALSEKKTNDPQNSFPNVTKLASFQKSPEKIAAGRGVFQSRCISCHGEKGQGVIGPNLADDYWLHGDGQIAAIAKTINDGVGDKGMPPWGPLLSEEELYAVSAYVRSLKGSNPPAAKAPQGQLIKE